MSTNIIYCYSGSGHCLDMARTIARVLGDTDIIMMRSFPEKTDATEARRVGFVFPCYGGGLPGGVEEAVKAVKLAPGAYTFAVEQYAGYLGCGLHKINEIVDLDYWAAVPNHSTAIWLMPHTLTLAPKPAQAALDNVERKAMQIGAAVRALKCSPKNPPRGALFELESKGLAATHAKRTEKFTVSDACISCETCVKLCPRGNIRLENGRPVFGKDCIGCLSCVQYCPKEAINIGRITEKRERFPNPRVKAADLMEKIIHVD